MITTPVLGGNIPAYMLELRRIRVQIFSLDDLTTSDKLARARGVITYRLPIIDDFFLSRRPNLSVVSNDGVGVDHSDLSADRVLIIPVGNTLGSLDQSTTDRTIALLLEVARNAVRGDQFARSAEFTNFDPKIMIGQEVSRSTLDIVGMGRIGKKVARRAAGFDTRIICHNRNRNCEAENRLDVKYRSLERLFRDSDYVTFNCPLTPATKAYIGEEQFALIKLKRYSSTWRGVK